MAAQKNVINWKSYVRVKCQYYARQGSKVVTENTHLLDIVRVINLVL
jgi:hypothetical protein